MHHPTARRASAFWAILAALAVWAAIGCTRRDKPEEFRIGMIAPISAPVRFTGHLLLRARVAELNAQGGLKVGGRMVKVRLIVEDSGSRVEQAMSAMSRLIQQERVSAVIGPDYSRDAIPVGAAMEALRVPMLTPSATNPEVTRGRGFVFRVCQVDSMQGETLARYAYEDLHVRRVALLFDESDAYSAGLAGYFRKAFLKRPGTIIVSEAYEAGTENFSAQMTRIRASGAQALFLPNFPGDLSRQLPQARAAGFTGQFIGGDSWDTDHGFHSLPEAQGAVYSTDYAAVAADPRLQGNVQTLADMSGAELNKVSALSFDALELLFAAAQRAGSTDPVSLRSGLAGLVGFNGLTGSISYAGGGDPQRSALIMGIQGGRLVLRARLAQEPRR